MDQSALTVFAWLGEVGGLPAPYKKKAPEWGLFLYRVNGMRTHVVRQTGRTAGLERFSDPSESEGKGQDGPQSFPS